MSSRERERERERERKGDPEERLFFLFFSLRRVIVIMRVPRSSSSAQNQTTTLVDVEKGGSRRHTNVVVASGEHANGTTTTTTTTSVNDNNDDDGKNNNNNDNGGVGVGIGSGNNHEVKAINSQLILNAPSTAKDKEPKIPMNKPKMHSSKFEKADTTTCVFSLEDSCLRALKCKEKGIPCVYKRRLSYRVPDNHPKYPGKRCCGTCYYRCTAEDGTQCAFVSDGTCAVANKKEQEGIKVAFSYLKYRVPSNHEKHAGKWCCNSCYHKCRAKGKLCAFVKNGTCSVAKEKEEKGLVLEYKNLLMRVPKTHPVFAGERCCDTCHNRVRAEGQTCVFAEIGECVHLNRNDVGGRWGRKVVEGSNNNDEEGENQAGQQDQQTGQKQYRRFHRVPASHPKYAGKPCCNACYILCKSQTEKCAFMDEGKCTYANRLLKKGERNIVYKNLTYRVPSVHDTHPGERCCRTCYRKCAEHAKEIRWATVLSNLLEKN